MAARPRLLWGDLPPNGGEVRLTEAAARHAAVLRLRPGNALWLFDGRGRVAEARVVSVAPECMVCAASPPRLQENSGVRVVLVLGMPKGSKVDTIVRAVTELGVDSIHLAWTERSVSNPAAWREDTRMRRLGRIVEEASRQAGRAGVPSVASPDMLIDVARRAPSDSLRLVCAPDAPETLRKIAGAARPLLEVWLVVGPEGGLSPSEIGALKAVGYREIRTGSWVLRVETAATVAVALVMEELASAPALTMDGA